MIGDGRLWRDRTREARRPAWRKKEKGSQGTASARSTEAWGPRLHAGVRAPIVAMKPVTPVERRGAGRWRRDDQIDGNPTGGSVPKD